MDVQAWFAEQFTETVSPDKLNKPRARQLAALIATGGYDGAELLECRRDLESGNEILLLRVLVPLGQRALVNDIEPEEPVAVLIGRDNLLPHAYPLRPGFPDHVPHFNVAPPDRPRSLCLYEVAAEEVRRTYTAIGFVERIRWWLAETAYGRLHGEAQPLDPLFQQTGLALIMPFSDIKPGMLYAAGRVSERTDSPVRLIVIDHQNAAQLQERQGLYAVVYLRTPPVEHGRIRDLPFDMAHLVRTYQEIGADISEVLGEALLATYIAAHVKFLLDQPLILIIETPLTRAGGGVEAKTVRAFIAHNVSAGNLAIKLGVLIKEQGIWGRPLLMQPEIQDLTSIDLIPADTHEPFDRARAQLASGYPIIEAVPTALLGAGALGSQIALIAGRGGYGCRIIIDNDYLFPHNLARHGLGPEYIGWSKAVAVCRELNGLLGDDTVEAIHDDILSPSGESRWPAALGDVQRVIDASASVPVARWLACDAEREAQAASCFLSPSGRDAVVLLEGEARSPRLDHLEMSYYRHLVGNAGLAGHLSAGEIALYVGGCRNPSVRIPQTQVAALTGSVVEALCRRPWPSTGGIYLWRSSEGLTGIAYHAFEGEPFEQVQVGEWTVWVRRGLLHEVAEARERAGRLETGGILVGTCDRDRKIIYVVSHYDPPPDSTHELTGFVRGTVGVYQTIVDVQARTADNLTYIGEWHTHPPGCGTRPSRDDEKLLWWIHEALRWSDAPALILIAGDDGYRLVLRDSAEQHFEGLI
ncbi:hypothetical protein ASG52_22660 [Methylobacterium sp. Leaf456]|uniref:Mov34/MPN/PAD-1 family protein n=1 Tax=Methylobacterium sp. Leaf456 TaxID=1736382 RepID=UPI0006FF09F8|nr:Mov34/MPN/PAD-1 family protein [Methylobacterium sp. Leaf456]KQT58252.1 hypothetical protein ASG52_22660 [Methylobacterium sp. Leaf456]